MKQYYGKIREPLHLKHSNIPEFLNVQAWGYVGAKGVGASVMKGGATTWSTDEVPQAVQAVDMMLHCAAK